jgi:hypothetical protein
MEQQARACEAVVVVLSPDLNSSCWVSKENLLAMGLNLEIDCPSDVAGQRGATFLGQPPVPGFRGDQDEALHVLCLALTALSGLFSMSGQGASQDGTWIPFIKRLRHWVGRSFTLPGWLLQLRLPWG